MKRLVAGVIAGLALGGSALWADHFHSARAASLAGGFTGGSGTVNVLAAWQTGGLAIGNSNPTITCNGTDCTLASGHMVLPSGSLTEPALRIGSQQTGWAVNAGVLYSVVAGAFGPYILNTSMGIQSDTASFTMGLLNDVVLARDAADTLALVRTTNAQVLRLYETSTDSTNYERGALVMGSDKLTIATQTDGSGTDNMSINLDPAGTGTIQIDGTDGVSGTCASVVVTKGIVTTCTP